MLPCCSPDGFLYDKEAIFEYIIQKKAENARKLKQYERDRRKEQEEMARLAAAEEESRAEKFLNMERSVVIKKDDTPKPSTSQSQSVSNMKEGRDKILPSFWIPSLTPQDKKKIDSKPPDQTIYCPMSGKPLKAKDLIPVNFTPTEKGLTREQLLTRKVC